MIFALILACAGTGGKPDDTPPLDSDAPPDTGDTAPVAPTSADLVDAITAEALLGHLDALQAAADAASGVRVVGSDGYLGSAEYVAAQLDGAGYAVTWQEFPWPVFSENADPIFEALGTTWVPGQDHVTFQYSGSGDVTAPLANVDLMLPPGEAANSSSSGCDPEDWADFPVGAIAVVQRGTCTFAEKAARADAAGAAGLVIFNEGQEGRQDVFSSSLSGETPEIPVIAASFALGEALAAGEGSEAHIVVDASVVEVPTWNLLADLPGETDQLVVVGAHLDSVAAGPGINDNGSGTATVLELALQSASLGLKPAHTLRFAFWGAEESGLIGSWQYLLELSDEDLGRHLANLNFDMLGSPNGGRFVYDGDGSAGLGGSEAPEGSAEIEALFTGWLDGQGQSWEATAFDGRSDYGPFIYAGVPAGGLFSGAEQPKSSDGEAAWGGDAGEAYDACYHQACDTSTNIDPVLLLDLARAAAWATGEVAINGLSVEPTARRRAPHEAPAEAHEHHACGSPRR